MPESKDMCRVALQDVVGAACMGIMSHVFRAPATVVSPVEFYSCHTLPSPRSVAAGSSVVGL
jgi:hypothetical protein